VVPGRVSDRGAAGEREPEACRLGFLRVGRLGEPSIGLVSRGERVDDAERARGPEVGLGAVCGGGRDASGGGRGGEADLLRGGGAPTSAVGPEPSTSRDGRRKMGLPPTV
jgi:hypothetical protein